MSQKSSNFVRFFISYAYYIMLIRVGIMYIKGQKKDEKRGREEA